MRGHEPLLAMRRQGKLSSRNVCVCDGDLEIDIYLANRWHEVPSSATGLYEPHVVIEEKDIPENLDLRFCIGLNVHLTAYRGEERAQRLFKALREAKPELLGCQMGLVVWYYSKEIGGNGKRIHC